MHLSVIYVQYMNEAVFTCIYNLATQMQTEIGKFELVYRLEIHVDILM